MAGKTRPFHKGPLVGAKVIQLAKSTVRDEYGIQNLLDANAVWAAYNADPTPPETVARTDVNGTATVQTFTFDAQGYAIYEDALNGTVNARIGTSGAIKRAVANGDCATNKHMQWVATVKTDGTLDIASAGQQHYTGSILTITYAEQALWNGESQLFPFIFEADSDWDVDLCALVPVGYIVVGAYDENGSPITGSGCLNVLVSLGEIEVITFEVVPLGQPAAPASLTAQFTIEHEGNSILDELVVPGLLPLVTSTGGLLTAGMAASPSLAMLALAAMWGSTARLRRRYVMWRITRHLQRR